jgi:hypothetical protein
MMLARVENEDVGEYITRIMLGVHTLSFNEPVAIVKSTPSVLLV